MPLWHCGNHGNHGQLTCTLQLQTPSVSISILNSSTLLMITAHAAITFTGLVHLTLTPYHRAVLAVFGLALVL